MLKNKYNIILALAFVVFFLIYNFTNIAIWWPMLSSTGHLIFNWPDASANYYFAELFARTNHLWFFETINIFTDNLIHPRSINVVSGSLVPVTWLPAVAIFGAAWRVLGSFGILAFTPFLAALSGLLFYRLVYYIFKDKDLALLSALLFWSLAPWVFFANVVMLPNILFLFLVLAGAWALARYLIFDKHLYWILACLLLSLAIFVRPTEIVWLSLIFIYLLYRNRQKIYFKHYVYGLVVLAGALLLFLTLNKSVYEAYFSVGYSNFQSGALASELAVSNVSHWWDYIKLLFVPFGFDFILILKNFYTYFIKLFASHVVLAVAALAIMLYKKQLSKIWKNYIFIGIGIFVLILVYYGSWNLADPLVKELNSISISYVRYFLPLYIWLIPLVAWGIKKIFWGQTKINKLSYYIVLVALILSSLKLAFYSEHDGLLANMDNLQDYYQQYQTVSEIVEDNAIIISERSDKVFFPKYKVIVYQDNQDLWLRASHIAEIPIYYYTDKSQEDFSVDQVALDKLNLKLENIGQIWHNFSLYKLIK